MTAHLARAIRALVLVAGLLAAIPAAAQEGHGLLPVATPEAAGSWQVVEQRELEIDGELVTLSPDGEWIAGIGPDRALCVWNVTTLDPICATEDLAVQAESIRWAPDSGAVAWSLDALIRFYDSDIFVMEVPDGAVTNLTDDGYAGGIPFGDDAPVTEIPVDMMPAWTPGSEALIFVRTSWSTEADIDEMPTDLMRVDRTGGDPEHVATVRDDAPWAVYTPMVVLDDGSVLYSVALNNDADPGNGLWLLAPGGEATHLLGATRTDNYPGIAIIDVRDTGDGLLVSAYSAGIAGRYGAEGNPSFLFDTATGTVTPLPRRDDRAVTPVRFTPDGTGTIGVEWQDGDPHLVVRDPSGVSDLGPVALSHGMISRGFDWSTTNLILAPNLYAGGTLLTVTPAES